MSKTDRLTADQKAAFLKVSGETDIEKAYVKVTKDATLLQQVEAIATPTPPPEPVEGAEGDAHADDSKAVEAAIASRKRR